MPGFWGYRYAHFLIYLRGNCMFKVTRGDHIKVFGTYNTYVYIPWISNVELVLLSEPPYHTIPHWIIVLLYFSLAGMVSVKDEFSPSVIVGEILRSLCVSGRSFSIDVPFTFQLGVPSRVTHVNTADWFRKTVTFSGFWSISTDGGRPLLCIGTHEQ